ncbi:MAG: hypothetical protein ACR2QK_05920 [Acidimicrobiales bacterium]
MTSHRVIDRRFPGVGLTRWATPALARTWWVATVALLLAGAVVRYDLITEDHLGPLARSEVAAGSATGFAAPASDFDSYAAVRYAGTDVALIDARSIPTNLSGHPIVVAELAVRNNSTVQARVPVNMISLVGPGGQATELDRFEYTDHAYRMVIDPGRTERGLAVFKLPVHASPQLNDYVLQIAERGRWPVSLPLEGPAAAAIYPQPLEAEGAEERARYRGLTVELTEATTALEYGVYRAPVGRHLAVVNVTVTGSPAGSLGTVERDLWTLLDGEAEERAIRAIVGRRPVGGNSVDMQLVFAYSTESSELTLTVGGPGERQTVAVFEVQAFE